MSSITSLFLVFFVFDFAVSNASISSLSNPSLFILLDANCIDSSLISDRNSEVITLYPFSFARISISL